MDKDEFLSALIFCSYLDYVSQDVNVNDLNNETLYCKLFKKYFPDSQIITLTMQENKINELLYHETEISSVIFEIELDDIFPKEFKVMSKENHYIELNAVTPIHEVILLLNKVNKTFLYVDKHKISFYDGDLIVPLRRVRIRG